MNKRQEQIFIYKFCTGADSYPCKMVGKKGRGHRPCRLSAAFFSACFLAFSFTSLSSLATLSLSLLSSSSSIFRSASFSKAMFSSFQGVLWVQLKLWCLCGKIWWGGNWILNTRHISSVGWNFSSCWNFPCWNGRDLIKRPPLNECVETRQQKQQSAI